jgi:hypothetical protein
MGFGFSYSAFRSVVIFGDWPPQSSVIATYGDTAEPVPRTGLIRTAYFDLWWPKSCSETHNVLTDYENLYHTPRGDKQLHQCPEFIQMHA